MTHEAKDRDRAIGARDGRTADEVIASIDSSGWAVDPVAHGMTAMEYQRGEAELLMSAFQRRAGGVNTFFHFPGLTRFGDNWVVSVNNDTVYSVAVIDARAGFAIEVPDMGDRLYTPQDGWNGILRAYRPDVEQMRGYRMPELERVGE